MTPFRPLGQRSLMTHDGPWTSVQDSALVDFLQRHDANSPTTADPRGSALGGAEDLQYPFEWFLNRLPSPR